MAKTKQFKLGYDTIYLELPVSNPQKVMKRLKSTYLTMQMVGERVAKHGMLKNLKVSALKDSIKVENSIARFYYDNNLHTLAPSEFKAAIRMLNEALDEDFFCADVTRIDLAGNVELDGSYTDFSADSMADRKIASVAEYLQTLGGIPDFDKSTHGNGSTVTYFLGRTGERFTLYDKVAEMRAKTEKNKGVAFPPEAEGKNILRLESVLGYGKASKMYGEDINVKQLMKKDFYEWICTHWYSRYNAIRKQRTLMPISLNASTSAQLEVFLASIGAAYLGDNYLRRQINGLSGNEKRNAKYLIETKLKKDGCMEHNTFVNEMDVKVKVLYENSIGVDALNQRNAS